MAHKQADGQWFLFNLTPERPADASQLEMLPHKDVDSTQTYVAAIETMSKEHKAILDEHIRNLQVSLREQSIHIVHQRGVLEGRHLYVQQLEAELARKNAALGDLEKRIAGLEVDLGAAESHGSPGSVASARLNRM